MPTPDPGGFIADCPHCDWHSWHTRLREADRARTRHLRDKHPKEPR